MNDHANPAATYRTIYDSVFHQLRSKTTTERPDREGKSFALTRAAFDAHRNKLIKTIACIANGAKSVGYLVCRGGSTQQDLVDGASVDDAIRSKIFPHVPLELERQNIDGNIVDCYDGDT